MEEKEIDGIESRYVPVLGSQRSHRRHVSTAFAIAMDLRWIRNCERAVERGANDPLPLSILFVFVNSRIILTEMME